MEENSTVPAQSSLPNLPICVSVKNHSEESRRIILFDPAFSEKGIDIESVTPGIRYKEVLRWMAVSKVTLSQIFIQVIGLDDHALDLDLFFDGLEAIMTSLSEDGDAYQFYLDFTRDPFRIQKDLATQIMDGFVFDRHTRFSLNIPPHACINIDVYPERPMKIRVPQIFDFEKEFGRALTLKVNNLSDEPMCVRLFDPEFSAPGFMLDVANKNYKELIAKIDEGIYEISAVVISLVSTNENSFKAGGDEKRQLRKFFSGLRCQIHCFDISGIRMIIPLEAGGEQPYDILWCKGCWGAFATMTFTLGVLTYVTLTMPPQTVLDISLLGPPIKKLEDIFPQNGTGLASVDFTPEGKLKTDGIFSAKSTPK